MPIVAGPHIIHDVDALLAGGLLPGGPLAYHDIAAAVTIGRHVAADCVIFDGVPNSVVALITNTARTNLARQMVEGLAFIVSRFQVGRGGYDPADPTQSTAPNPAAVALIDPIWPSPTTYHPIDSVEYPNNESVAWLCRLETTEALVGIGELGLWAQITASPLNPAEVGTWFLFAIAHMPMQAKAIQQVYGWRIAVAP